MVKKAFLKGNQAKRRSFFGGKAGGAGQQEGKEGKREEERRGVDESERKAWLMEIGK